MITEDYCSYEVAELLREKGFKEPVTELNRLLFEEGKKPLLKITHQKAMKWLRLVHDVLVTPYALSLGYYFEIFDLTNRDITGCKPLYKVGVLNKEAVLSTYEEACDAAIKYCLENLI